MINDGTAPDQLEFLLQVEESIIKKKDGNKLGNEEDDIMNKKMPAVAKQNNFVTI